MVVMLYEKLSAASIEQVWSERHSHKIEMTKLPPAYPHRAAAYTHTHTEQQRENGAKGAWKRSCSKTVAWIDK